VKTTIDNPESVLQEALRHTRARTKREAILTAVERFNKLKRLEALNARIRGQFRDFMTPAELAVLREDTQGKVVR